MDWIAAHSENLGLTVAVILGLALISGLVLVKGRDAGLTPGHLYRQLAQVWIALLLALATLLGVRALLGGPVVSGPAQELRLSALSTPQLVLLVGGLLVVVACVLWARRAVAGLADRPTRYTPGGDDEPPC